MNAFAYLHQKATEYLAAGDEDGLRRIRRIADEYAGAVAELRRAAEANRKLEQSISATGDVELDSAMRSFIEGLR